MKIRWLAERLLRGVEQTPLTYIMGCISFAAIIALRLLEENLVFRFELKTVAGFTGSMLHTLLFFGVSYVLMVLYLKMGLKSSFTVIHRIMLWGLWLILLPPLIDKAIFQEREFFSFYIFDSLPNLLPRFLTLFGDHPEFGITYGVRVEVVCAVLALSMVWYLKTNKKSQALLGGLGLYGILFFLGCFPSFVAYLMKGTIWLSGSDIAQVFMSPLYVFSDQNQVHVSSLHYKMSLIYNIVAAGLFAAYLWIDDRKKWWAMVQNMRFPQVVFHAGALLGGVFVGLNYYPQRPVDIFSYIAVMNLLIAVISSWIFSVVVNDVVDQNIDQVTNPDRPIIKKIFSVATYLHYGFILLILSLTSALTVGGVFFLTIIAYHFITTVYSCYPFRLKRFVGIASILSSVAIVLIFLMGYVVVAPNHDLSLLPWRLVVLLFVVYALSIPLKDLKDIEGDRRDEVYTLPVLLGEEWARTIHGLLILGSFFLSVFLLKEKQLFLPALFFGSIAFWVINTKKISPRKLPAFVVTIVTGYVLVALGFLFLK